MAVHESLRLHIAPDKFFFEPLDTGQNELLVFDRLTQELSLQENSGQIPADAVVRPVCGIFGIIRLVAGPYLIVITSKEKIGDIRGHSLWRVTGTEMHSYKRNTMHLTEKQVRNNSLYLSMVENVLNAEHYYFSYAYDLTHTMQRLYNTSPDFISMPLHERADQRFLWNGHVLRELSQQPELSQYCLPILHGFISIRSCFINSQPIDYILISRRSVYRAGTRFNVRGLDDGGQVANFIETEQMLQYDGHYCSYVQTRGSIPLYWTQKADLKYKPKAQIRPLNHMAGLQRHFDDQIYNYGDQVIVNLLCLYLGNSQVSVYRTIGPLVLIKELDPKKVNGKGSEGLLAKALEQSLTNTQNNRLQYEFFDFHHECGLNRWDRLSILVDKLEKVRKQYGYFMMMRDGHIPCQQDGVFRSNCMDCLDRTNVVQGLFAKVTLEDQLQRLGVLGETQKVDDFTQFKYIYNNIWADNADMISKQYAGTGALKTDFTRIGKRTQTGLVMDGWNSLIRYFKNNFSDGFRQDSLDLFLGNYQVEENEGISTPSPLQLDRDWKFYAIPVIFVIAFSMCVISMLLPDEHVSEQLMYVLFWGTASFISLGVMYMFGKEFVDRPRLVHTKLKME